MPITFGRVAHPPFRDRLVPNAQTTAWDDLGPRTPVGVCWRTTPEHWPGSTVVFVGLS